MRLIKRGAALSILLAMFFLSTAPANGIGLSPDPDGLSGNERGIWIPPAGSVYRAVSKVITVSQKLLDVAKQELALAQSKPLAYAGCRTVGNCVGIAGESICGVDPATGYGYVYRITTVIVPFEAEQFHAYGVWDIYGEEDCHDPAEYYIWRFQVSGNTKSHYTLDRLKGRSYADTYQTSGWFPPANDQDVGNPTTISGTLGAKGLGVEGGVGVSYQLFPGRRHSYVGENIYHNSWISNSKSGAGCCPGPSIETDGANEWKTTKTDSGLQGEARIEIWFHDCNALPHC